MVSKENIVSLVVEGDHSSSLELRLLREETGQQTSDGMAQPSGEVVQDHLGLVSGHPPMTLEELRGGRKWCKERTGGTNRWSYLSLSFPLSLPNFLLSLPYLPPFHPPPSPPFPLPSYLNIISSLEAREFEVSCWS